MIYKLFKICLISILTALALIAGYWMYTSGTKSPSELFTQLIYERNDCNLSNDRLEKYKSDINEELSSVTKRTTLLTSYLSLGKISALQKDYEESTRYLINALSFTLPNRLELTFLIYEQLALNYIQMNQKEKGYEYFQLAYELANELNDVHLITSLYQSFAQKLFLKKDDVEFSISLLNKTFELVANDKGKVRSHTLLAFMYQSLGAYDLALSEWNEALKISRQINYKYLEREILERLASLYFFTEQYEEVIKTLDNYFKFHYSQLSLDYISIWIESYYQIHGFEATYEKIHQMEDEVDYLSKNKSGYEYLNYFNYASILLQEKRYEECYEYIKKLESLDIQESEGSITKLWIDKLKLDFHYAQKNEEIDYKEGYSELLNLITEEKQYYTQEEYILIHSLLKELSHLKDVESIEDYYLIFQFPVEEDLEIMTSITMYNSITNIVKKPWGVIQSLTIFYYIAIIIIIAAIVYQFGYHYPKIKLFRFSILDMTETDLLTNTLKKEVMYEQLEFGIDSKKLGELSFILLDIDDFKSYNKEFGYLSGDKVLQQIAVVLKQFFPQAYICRYFSQQFLIIIKNDQQPLELELINQLMEEIKTNKSISDKREITVGVGISCGQLENSLEIERYIEMAKNNLQISKAKGRGICTF